MILLSLFFCDDIVLQWQRLKYFGQGESSIWILGKMSRFSSFPLFLIHKSKSMGWAVCIFLVNVHMYTINTVLEGDVSTFFQGRNWKCWERLRWHKMGSVSIYNSFSLCKSLKCVSSVYIIAVVSISIRQSSSVVNIQEYNTLFTAGDKE